MNSPPRQDDSVDEPLESRKLEKRLLRILIVSIVSAVVVFAAYFFRFHGPLAVDAGAWGQFGDYVGGILNPLFGLLALIGLLLTIVLQSRGLEISQRELKLSTKELRNSATALRQQNESLEKQNFENAFFQLLRFQNEILNGIDIREDTANLDALTVGRDCFREFYLSYQDQFTGYESDQEIDRISEAWSLFYEDAQSDLGHYFRHLYHIVKFINKSEVADRRYYTNLVRAQLSSYELVLLFYNCLSPNGREKFKPLIEKYALLKNMPRELVLRGSHLSLYANSAYGGNDSEKS